MTVRFFDLGAQTRALRTDVDAAVARVLDSGRFVLGAELEAFEDEFARAMGAAHAVGVNSGTDALTLALLAAGVGPGDDVVTAANTFTATAMAISLTGARCVLADCDASTGLLTADTLGRALTPATRAIVPVHLYGQPVRMDEVLDLADAHGALVVQDACQAHGATDAGRPLGRLGAAACYSFFPSKNLGAAGDGGAIVTGDASLAQRARALRDFGQSEKHHHEVPGLNTRLDEVQAAILRVKLVRLPDWNEARAALSRRYDELLAGSPAVPVATRPGAGHVRHLYVVRVPGRDGVRAALGRAGVETGVHYPVAVHLQPAHAGLGYAGGDFPAAERLAAEVLSLPMYPELPASSVERAARALLRAVCNEG